MSALAMAFMWSAVQVTIISAFGVTISFFATRRFPKLSATSTAATAVMVVVSTLMIPMQPLHWIAPAIQKLEVQEPSPANQNATFPSELDQQQNSSSGFTFSLDMLGSLALAARDYQQSHLVESNWTIHLLMWSVAAVVLFGICQLVKSFYCVAQTHRKSVLVEDELACQVLQKLAHEMSCKAAVQLRVSSELKSPAVLGWLSPLILLPPEWQSWEPNQLRAVLAHELAHVVRRDFFWRMLASIAQAIHFYNPLTHWLLRRLAFSQELAADQLAAATIKSRRVYSKSLSQLAIQQDDLSRLRAEPILLPALSSHLIRRIKMLRAKECNERGRLHLAIRLVSVCLIVLLGMGAITLRGIAQPVEPETKLEVEERFRSDAIDTVLHNRLPSFPLIDQDNEHGVFVIKVAEILKEKSLQPYLPTIYRTVSKGWKDLFSVTEAPDINLEAIEYITGMAMVEVKRRDSATKSGHKNQLMIGGPYGLVRFTKDVSSWKEWIRTYIPDAEEMQSDGTVYFRLPVIPALGPKPGFVAGYDDKTLIITTGEEVFKKVLGKEFQEAGTRWDGAWKSLDTGLVSLISSNHEIDQSLFASEKPESRALDQILDNIERVGYSADWNDESGQMGVKIQLYCANQSSAGKVSEAIERFSSMKLQEAKNWLKDFDSAEEAESAVSLKETSQLDKRAECLQAIDFLEDYEERSILNPDQTVTVEAVITMDFSLIEFIQEMITTPEEVAAAESQNANK